MIAACWYICSDNVESDTMKDYRIMKQGAHYIQGIFADERYIYAGVGVGEDIQAVIKCDKQTGEKTEVVGSGSGTTFYYVYVNDSQIITLVNGGIIVFDKESGKRIKVYNATRIPERPYPKDENIFYDFYNDKIVKCDLKNGTQNIVKELGGNGQYKCGKWAKMGNEWVLTFYTSFMQSYGYYNPETNEIKTGGFSDVPDSGPNIQCLEISPENVIYMGGYQTATSAYDIKNEEFVYKIPNWTQNEGTGFLNGKTYFGTYTDAVMYRYDPTKPLNYKPYNYDGEYQGAEYNSTMVYDIQDSQDRPFVVKEYKDSLYVGTMPGYGFFGRRICYLFGGRKRKPKRRDI